MLTRHLYPNTSDLGKPREPAVSRNYKNPGDAFGRPLFGRLSRLALRGEHQLLRRSRLDGSPDRNRQPAVERAKHLHMDDDQCHSGRRRRDDLFLGAKGSWHNAADVFPFSSDQKNR